MGLSSPCCPVSPPRSVEPPATPPSLRSQRFGPRLGCLVKPRALQLHVRPHGPERGWGGLPTRSSKQQPRPGPWAPTCPVRPPPSSPCWRCPSSLPAVTGSRGSHAPPATFRPGSRGDSRVPSKANALVGPGPADLACATAFLQRTWTAFPRFIVFLLDFPVSKLACCYLSHFNTQNKAEQNLLWTTVSTSYFPSALCSKPPKLLRTLLDQLPRPRPRPSLTASPPPRELTLLTAAMAGVVCPATGPSESVRALGQPTPPPPLTPHPSGSLGRLPASPEHPDTGLSPPPLGGLPRAF